MTRAPLARCGRAPRYVPERARFRRGRAAASAVIAATAILATAACGLSSGAELTPAGGAPPAASVPSTTEAAPAADTMPTPTYSAPGSPMLGVFRGTSKEAVASFEQWLGRPVDAVVDFVAADTWAQIADPTYLLDHWRGTPYRLVLSVPLYPLKEEADRRAAAAGAYDIHFAALGRRMVQQGRGDAWIRVGWEFNMADSYSYSTDPALFTAAFRRVVEALRSAPGQHFTVVWNPGNGDQQQDAARFYPGNDVVDIVGVDIYDTGYHRDGYPVPPGCLDRCHAARSAYMWDTKLYGGARGLRFWVNFAATHEKPIALPEWGLWSSAEHTGGDDNPDFIRRMHAFISERRSRVIMHAYFEWDNPHDRHSLLSFPGAAATFHSYWGAS